MEKEVIIDGIKYIPEPDINSLMEDTWKAAREHKDGLGIYSCYLKHKTLADYKATQPIQQVQEDKPKEFEERWNKIQADIIEQKINQPEAKDKPFVEEDQLTAFVNTLNGVKWENDFFVRFVWGITPVAGRISILPYTKNLLIMPCKNTDDIGSGAGQSVSINFPRKQSKQSPTNLQESKCTCKVGEHYNNLCCPVHGSIGQPSTTVKDKQEWVALEIECYGGEVRKLIDGLYRIYSDGVGFEFGYLMNREDSKILSVKRLSDGEVFSIGDTIEGSQHNNRNIVNHYPAEITSIYPINGTIALGYGNGGAIIISHAKKLTTPNTDTIRMDNLNNSIEFAEKMHEIKSDTISSKPVLFTTEYGVDIKEDDNYFFVDAEWNVRATADNYNWVGSLKAKNFSTKAAAEQYILENKPCLSLKEIWSITAEHGLPLVEFEKQIGEYANQKLKQ